MENLNFDETIEKELNKENLLSSSEYNDLYNKLSKEKDIFLSIKDSPSRNNKLRETAMFINGIGQNIENKNKLADFVKTNMKYDANIPIFKVISDLFNNNLNSFVNNDGKVVYSYKENAPKGFEGNFTMEDISKEAESKKIDNFAAQKFNLLIENSMADLENAIKTNGDTKFPEKKIYNQILNGFVKNPQTSNFSIINHPLFGNNSFKQNLAKHLESGTYSDLGITPEQVELMDPTKYDSKITEDDAMFIANKFVENTDNESVLKEAANYYTKIIEKQWQANTPNDSTIVDDTPINFDPSKGLV
tara:strand:- start:9416 stop:10327 length:912 start_codon:yes stop_codon:yes gene_type:complete